MKKTSWKNTIRDITSSLNRFIVILIISALGAGFFSGLKASGPDMRATAEQYFTDTNLMDYRMLSTMGFTNDDLDALKTQDGIEAVMPAYRVDLLVGKESMEEAMRLHSLPDANRQGSQEVMNQLTVLEGRLPERDNECVVGRPNFRGGTPYKIGDKLTILESNKTSSLDLIRPREFEITGFVRSPLYLSNFLGVTDIGSGTLSNFGYVLPTAFESDYYTEVFLTASGVEDMDSQSEEYQALMKRGQTALEVFGEERAKIRYEKVYSKAQQELADGEERLKEAEEELQNSKLEAEEKLLEARNTIEEGEAQLGIAKQKIDNGQNALQTKQQQLEAGQNEIDQKSAELQAAQTLLFDNQAKYDVNVALYNQKKADYQSKKAEWESTGVMLQTYDSGVAAVQQTMDGMQALLPGLPIGQEAFLKLANGLIELMDATTGWLQNSTDPKELVVIAYFDGVNNNAKQAAAAGNNQLLYDTLSAGLLAPLPNFGGARGVDLMEGVSAGVHSRLDALSIQLQQAEAALAETKVQLDRAAESLLEGQQKLQEGQSQLAVAQQRLNDGTAQIANAKAAITKAQADLAKGRQDLDAAQTEYEQKKAETNEKLADAEQQISSKEKELEEGREKLEELKEPKWYVFLREGNPGYTGFFSDAERISSIATVIPPFFFLVAALVCLTTMTRMVEEQRTQIGTKKAMGFSKSAIAFKYVFYAGAASGIGAVLGIVVGMYLFPTAIWKAYGILYTMPEIVIGGNTGIVLFTFAVAVLCTTLAAFAACYSELVAVPAQLMRPKAPAAGNRVLLEKATFIWKRLKFSDKVTVRNLLRNKKRFFMTIIGITGCTCLLISGLGLRDAINGIAPRQFGVLNHYDIEVSFASPMQRGEDKDLDELVSSAGESLYILKTAVDVSSDTVKNANLETNILVIEHKPDLQKFYTFQERNSEKPLPFLEDGGVLVTEKLANKLNVKVGDTILMNTKETDGTEKSGSFTVAGIAENYVYNLVYMSPGSYETGFKQKPEFNGMRIRLDDASLAERNRILDKLVNDKNIAGALDIEVLKQNVEDTLSSLNSVVWLVIGCAAALAFVVLYNLTEINITERKREVATLKVLGFFNKEVYGYIYRENIVLTLIGILLGLIGGTFLAMYVISTAEVDNVMFSRTIKPLSYIISVVFTGVVAFLVNLLMRRKLRAIDMVESLKSAE